MDDEAKQEELQFEELIQGLLDHNYGCIDNFVLPSTVTGLNANILSLNTAGNMQAAGFGNKTDFQTNLLVRGDKINWIQEESTNPFETIYLKKIWSFINY